MVHATKLSALALTALHCFMAVGAGESPSCENDIAAHCLGDDSDMSTSGIQTCLASLGAGDRSALCNDYLMIIETCYAEIGKGGLCEADHKEGDTMPCLIQRSKPEDLSALCRNALPVEEVKTGIKDTFWKNGKRLLEDDEIAELDENDADTYTRWVKKKKKNQNSAHGKDKDFAILKMKQEKTKQTLVRLIVAELAEDAERLLSEDKSNSDMKEMLTKKVKRKVKNAKKEGMDAGDFDKAELKDVVKKIMKAAAKAGKGEL